MTDKIDFYGEGSEFQRFGVVLEDCFPKDALSTDRSDSCERKSVEPTCSEIALFVNSFTAAFSADEVLAYVFFASKTSY